MSISNLDEKRKGRSCYNVKKITKENEEWQDRQIKAEVEISQVLKEKFHISE